MKISVVVGFGFGDEGKGSTVNSLITDPKNTIVVRFNGGHQVGHTVVYNGIRHPFSNFGSGTLKGVPTYWSEFCTVNPMAVKKEGDVLRGYGLTPMIHYNSNAMVTTPYDIYQNLKDNNNLNHGSVGVGFGKTIQRNEDHYHLYVRDLLFPKIRDEKLELISQYYGRDDLMRVRINKVIDEFKSACDELVKRYVVVNNSSVLNTNQHIIFEGGQGILLDMDYGFFPHVTRSNTTSKNAIEIINQLENRFDYYVQTYYVTRAYLTRHGNGYMSNQELDNSFIQINPNETNTDDGWQGKFKRTMLDYDLLKYAESCDRYHNDSNKYNLIITCLDHINNEKIKITRDGEIKQYLPIELGAALFGHKIDVITTNSDKGFAYLD